MTLQLCDTDKSLVALIPTSSEHSPSSSSSPDSVTSSTCALDLFNTRQTSASFSASSIEIWLQDKTSPSTPLPDELIQKTPTTAHDIVEDHSFCKHKRKRGSFSADRRFTKRISPSNEKLPTRSPAKRARVSPTTQPVSLVAPISRNVTCSLTKQNLKNHTKMMAAQTGVPHDSTSSVTSTPSNKNPKWVRQRMKDHHLFRDDDAFDKPEFSSFRQKVFSDFEPKRRSGVEAEAVSNFYNTCIQNGVTEETFKSAMLRSIVNDDFQVVKKPGVPDEGIEPVYEHRNMLKEGIFCQRGQPLRRGLLPHTYRGKSYQNPAALKSALQDDGMFNSVPDGTWGYLETSLNANTYGATLPSRIKALLTVCPALYCPCFFLEAKPDGGSSEECRNQAGRAGATLVNAMRQLLSYTGRKSTLGLDAESYLYGATMNEECMEWWVNWAEVREGDVVCYHMNRLERVEFGSNDSLLRMRRFTHNILEWGMTTRLPAIRKLVEDLHKREALLPAERDSEMPAPAPKSTKRKKANST